MVLELLFEYGEHESSSVAQILNVVQYLFLGNRARYRFVVLDYHSSSNRIDCISSSLNRGWFEMVLELLFEYGEHESSSVAQILNVVQTLNVCIE